MAAAITQNTTRIAPAPIMRDDGCVSTAAGSGVVSGALRVVFLGLVGLFARVDFFAGITSSIVEST